MFKSTCARRKTMKRNWKKQCFAIHEYCTEIIVSSNLKMFTANNFYIKDQVKANMVLKC